MSADGRRSDWRRPASRWRRHDKYALMKLLSRIFEPTSSFNRRFLVGSKIRDNNFIRAYLSSGAITYA